MTRRPRWSRAERGYMEQALALGASAEGQTSPNPRVGCVLVRDGGIVGRGFHRAPGMAHAEAMALSEAGPSAQGATVFVNLEPCAHQGRTGPCVDLLIRAGVARVLAGVRDPNPLVDGRGFARLREAGIPVDVGLLEADSRRLNDAFFFWHGRGRPLVTLKAAISLDGRISAAGGVSRWITGTAARRFAHRLRLRHDAILVGAGTVRHDDPALTVRLGGSVLKRPVAVVSRTLKIPPDRRLLTEQPSPQTVRVYSSAEALPDLPGHVRFVRIREDDRRLVLDDVLDDLGQNGVQSVLVEGGGRTFDGFLSAGLADRVALFVSGKLMGARGSTPLIDGLAVRSPERAWRTAARRIVPLGEDWLVLADLLPPLAEAPGGSGCSPG